MSVLVQLAEVLRDLLHHDDRRVLLGEDVRDGGMLGLSRLAAEDQALRDRLVATPLTGAAAFAHAAGLALAGRRPILLCPSASPFIEGLGAVRELAKLAWRTGDDRSVSLLMLAPFGPGFGLGGDAGDPVDALLAGIPGLRVLCPGSAGRVASSLRLAADFVEGVEPTVILMARTLLLQEFVEPDAAPDPRLGHARRVRDGNAATVFAWGAAVELAQSTVDQAQLDAAVIDVGCLAPLDRTSLIAAARETGKIVIVHAGPPEHGIGAELAAMFADEAILHLDAPVIRVTGARGPCSPAGELTALPEPVRIAAAIERVIDY